MISREIGQINSVGGLSSFFDLVFFSLSSSFLLSNLLDEFTIVESCFSFSSSFSLSEFAFSTTGAWMFPSSLSDDGDGEIDSSGGNMLDASLSLSPSFSDSIFLFLFLFFDEGSFCVFAIHEFFCGKFLFVFCFIL